MRCLHCGKKVPFLRRFSNEEFCSDAHRSAFQQQQQQIALSRLQEAGRRLEPPPQPAVRKKSPARVPDPPEAGPLAEKIGVVGRRRLHVLALEPYWTMGTPVAPVSPVVLPRNRSHGLENPMSWAPAEMPVPATAEVVRTVAAMAPAADLTLPALCGVHRGQEMAEPADPPSAELLPLTGVRILAGTARPALMGVERLEAAPMEVWSSGLDLTPEPVRMVPPVRQVEWEVARAEEAPPLVKRLYRVFSPEPSGASIRPAGLHSAPGWAHSDRVPERPPARLDFASPGFGYAATTPMTAVMALGGLPLPYFGPPVRWTESRLTPGLPDETVEYRLPEAEVCDIASPLPVTGLFELRTGAGGAMPGKPGREPEFPLPDWNPVEPVLANAGASGIPVAAVGLAAAIASPAAVAVTARVPDPVAPRHVASVEQVTGPIESTAAVLESEEFAVADGLMSAQVLAAAEGSGEDLEREAGIPPALTRALPIHCPRAMGGNRVTARRSEKAARSYWHEPMEAMPELRGSGLRLDHADGSGPRPVEVVRRKRLNFEWLRMPRLPRWGGAWRHAPADLKWVSLAIPAVLVLVVYSLIPDQPINPAAGQAGAVEQAEAPTVLGDRFSTLQKVIMERAAIRLVDDFRSGLGAWSGGPGWAKTWQYNAANFVSPGRLALYGPTSGMRDYEVAFLAQIDRRSLNWVVRAADEKNYHVIRILITQPGPLPKAVVQRYPVIGGRPGAVTTLPLPIPVRTDTLYKVRMEVKGDRFITYVQDQVVDSFTDSRLAAGGVGFFSPPGDRALLRWVSVTHQYDYLGRICALLAPHSVQAEGRRVE